MLKHWAAAALIFATLAGSQALADPVADFYKGKQLQLIVGYGPGGGNDVYARLLARHMGRHIPGNPGIVVQNMPGAGGIRAMNHLYAVAPKDGTVMGLVHSSVPFAPLYGIQGASVDPRKMNWIGSMNASTAICVAWHTSGIKDWQDLMTKEYLVGGTGAGSQMETMPAMLNQLFGTKMKVISG